MPGHNFHALVDGIPAEGSQVKAWVHEPLDMESWRQPVPPLPHFYQARLLPP